MALHKFKYILAGIIVCWSLDFLLAQDVAIREVELKGGNIILHYDLKDENPDRKYTLRLYSSLDNFVQPLEKVTGDIGIGIPVGGNKQVTWQAREELDSAFDGNITLELKGQLYIPFITLSHFEDFGTFKRGKPYDVTWSGGRGDNVLNFDLYRGDEKVWTQPNIANTGNLRLIIPTNVKPGKKYVFRISDAKNPDEVVLTDIFSIRRKIPLGLKIFGGAIIATGIYLLTDAIIPPGTNTIPDPLPPPEL